MIGRQLQLILLLLVLVPQPAVTADTVVGDACNLAALGAADKRGFLKFHQELRSALAKPDKAALALLVSFPLRVHHADGSATTLANARALQTRFDQVLPQPVRSAVLDQKLETLFCKYTGVMYGRGEIWIRLLGQDESQRYRITTINLPATGGQRSTGDEPRLEFVCDAQRQRVVIDTLPSGELRYRSWLKPSLLGGKPDAELSPGAAHLAGTSPCTHALWTFKTDETEVTVSELGCTEGSVPSGVTGRLEVAVAGEARSWWCY